MLQRLFGRKPKPPTLPLADRPSVSTIADGANSTSTLVVRDVTDLDFDEVALQNERLTVVDFWAEWCQPCTIISAYTEWLARDYGAQLLVVALDVDENPLIPERYSIMGLPTLLFFRNGIEVARQVGLLSYEELRAQVDALLAQSAAA